MVKDLGGQNGTYVNRFPSITLAYLHPQINRKYEYCSNQNASLSLEINLESDVSTYLGGGGRRTHHMSLMQTTW